MNVMSIVKSIKKLFEKSVLEVNCINKKFCEKVMK